jgi:hypothetical protein
LIRYLAFSVAAIALLAAVTAGALAHFGRDSSPQLESFGPSVRALRATQTFFQAESPQPGMIPGGRALRNVGRLRHETRATDVHYSLVFGRFSDPDLGIMNRGVWILTTRQFGVPINHGPSRGPLRPTRLEGNCVIDAKTGKYLEGFGA